MEPEALEALRRNSRITMTRDGELLFAGRPIAHPRVNALFHRGIEVREDGEVILRVGHMWAYLECEGVARFVDGLSDGPDGLAARLRGGALRPVAGATIGYAPDDRFYLWFGGVPGAARVARGAHQQLAGMLVEGPAVYVGDRRVVVSQLPSVPGAAAAAPQSGR